MFLGGKKTACCATTNNYYYGDNDNDNVRGPLSCLDRYDGDLWFCATFMLKIYRPREWNAFRCSVVVSWAIPVAIKFKTKTYSLAFRRSWALFWIESRIFFHRPWSGSLLPSSCGSLAKSQTSHLKSGVVNNKNNDEGDDIITTSLTWCLLISLTRVWNTSSTWRRCAADVSM